ncbi:hypothetical protein HanHA89_Chr17g0695881 [Helianthus annuus]|nr:hypothetical protein HanHA89_Chr17g0695881 [Helianthus annuus]
MQSDLVLDSNSKENRTSNPYKFDHQFCRETQVKQPEYVNRQTGGE